MCTSLCWDLSIIICHLSTEGRYYESLMAAMTVFYNQIITKTFFFHNHPACKEQLQPPAKYILIYFPCENLGIKKNAYIILAFSALENASANADWNSE